MLQRTKTGTGTCLTLFRCGCLSSYQSMTACEVQLGFAVLHPNTSITEDPLNIWSEL